jgi:hypothetical protein
MPRLSNSYNFNGLYTRKTLRDLAVKTSAISESSSVSSDCAAEEDLHIFEGKLSINNWALTRRQAKIAAISFETISYNVYSP